MWPKEELASSPLTPPPSPQPPLISDPEPQQDRTAPTSSAKQQQDIRPLVPPDRTSTPHPQSRQDPQHCDRLPSAQPPLACSPTPSLSSNLSSTSCFSHMSKSSAHSMPPPEHFYAGLPGEGFQRTQYLLVTGQLYGAPNLPKGRRGGVSGPSESYYEGRYEREDREGRGGCAYERGRGEEGKDTRQRDLERGEGNGRERDNSLYNDGTKDDGNGH